MHVRQHNEVPYQKETALMGEGGGAPHQYSQANKTEVDGRGEEQGEDWGT